MQCTHTYMYTCSAPFGADGLINKINLFNSIGVTESYIAKTQALHYGSPSHLTALALYNSNIGNTVVYRYGSLVHSLPLINIEIMESTITESLGNSQRYFEVYPPICQRLSLKISMGSLQSDIFPNTLIAPASVIMAGAVWLAERGTQPRSDPPGWFHPIKANGPSDIHWFWRDRISRHQN